MIRQSLLVLSSTVLLVACSQTKSDEPAAESKAGDAISASAAAILEKAAAPAPEVEIPAIPEVVAKIDDSLEIKGAELQKLIEPQLKSIRSMGAGAQQLMSYTKNLRKEGLDRLVFKAILLREATAQSFSVTDEEVDEFIKKNLPAEESAEDFAKAQGITVEDLKEDVRSGLTINKLLDKQVESLAELTDEDLKAEYDKIEKEQPKAFDKPESVQASHILVKVEKGANEEAKAAARKKIEELRQKIVDGADFAEVAKENSDCPSGSRGGDLGQFGRGQMVKPFEEAAFTQPVGELGPIVETDFGFHIIKVTNRSEAGRMTFEDVKEDLKKYLENNRKNEVVQKFVGDLRDKAKVETFLPDFEIPEDVPPAAARELPEWAQ